MLCLLLLVEMVERDRHFGTSSLRALHAAPPSPSLPPSMLHDVTFRELSTTGNPHLFGFFSGLDRFQCQLTGSGSPQKLNMAAGNSAHPRQPWPLYLTLPLASLSLLPASLLLHATFSLCLAFLLVPCLLSFASLSLSHFHHAYMHASATLHTAFSAFLLLLLYT